MLLDILIVLIKAALALGALLQLAALTTWFERKGSALIQDRMGANRAAIFGFDLAGIFNTLVADPVKALLKEDFVPRNTTQFMHSLGPFLAVFPVLISFAVVPFGPPIVWGDRTITLQLANLNVGILYVFAMGSLAVYGVVMAAWVSNNKFAFFGGLRASAQMISYEITMGISIVGVLMLYQTLDLNGIIDFQGTRSLLGGLLPAWGIFLNPIGFILFFTSMMAETKRAPFDLPESESELVAGYMTEYSGMKFLLFWLGEFAEIGVASTMVTLLFLGGWHLPWFDITTIPPTVFTLPFVVPGILESVEARTFHFQWAPLIGAGVLGAKVALLSMLQVTIRWTLPRFRYDQLMRLCWKWMLPVCLVNLFVTLFFVLGGVYEVLGLEIKL